MAEIYIPITGSAAVLVDERDVPLVVWSKWHLHAGYAAKWVRTKNGRKKVYMHRVIARAGRGQIVDHINCDKLDNRRSNLRIASRALNRVNVKRDTQMGVSHQPNNPKNPWRARFAKEYLGSFATYEEAVMARQARETMLQ
ncbi:homing endonuclease [Caudoviricetes sp.]|nr:homing endonuclease [Caudoviricetes sp.]